MKGHEINVRMTHQCHRVLHLTKKRQMHVHVAGIALMAYTASGSDQLANKWKWGINQISAKIVQTQSNNVDGTLLIVVINLLVASFCSALGL